MLKRRAAGVAGARPAANHRADGVVAGPLLTTAGEAMAIAPRVELRVSGRTAAADPTLLADDRHDGKTNY